MGGRARDYFAFDGVKGDTNSIVDVDGVLVGHSDVPPNLPDYRTGVTAILPQGNFTQQKEGYQYGYADRKDNFGIDTAVPAAWFTLNGNGEMTGTHCIDELGLLEGPIMLTNTAAVGTVRNAVIHYAYAQQQPISPDDFQLYLPIVAETYDGWLNEILNDQLQVSEAIAITAITNATKTADNPATPEEGNVGGGTSMTCYSWKGGIGTASRKNIRLHVWDNGEVDNAPPQWRRLPNQPKDDKGNVIGYTVGVLVQANQGTYWDLVIRGVPVGTIMSPPDSPDNAPPEGGPNPTPTDTPKDDPCVPNPQSRATAAKKPESKSAKNSIIVVIATIRCCPASSSGWPVASHLALGELARSRTTTPGRSLSPFRPPTRMLSRTVFSANSSLFPTTVSIHCSKDSQCRRRGDFRRPRRR